VPKRDSNFTDKDSNSIDGDPNYWLPDPFTGNRAYFNKNQFGFDRLTVEAFTEGDCWRLAFELHQKLDWPVFVITGVEMALTDRPSMYFGHMFVQNPATGKFLDINGEHPEDELLQQNWGVDIDAPVICEVTDDLNISQSDRALFKSIDASSIADKIIDRLNLEKTHYPRIRI
jgi:hypothetical protein